MGAGSVAAGGLVGGFLFLVLVVEEGGGVDAEVPFWAGVDAGSAGGGMVEEGIS